MTSPIKIGDAKVCSIPCKYAYLMLRAAETCTPGGDGKFNPVSFASEAKKIMEELLKEPLIQAAGKGPVPHFPEPMRIEPHPPVPLPIINPPPTSDIFANPLSVQCMTDFKWDTDACGANIAFVDNEKHCFLSEGGYCFRSALGNVGFTGGVHYWEIHGDPKSENELKLGVTSKKNFNLNTAFCDYDHGWAYYGLGQLRHGNNSTGQKYGKPFKNTGYIGVFLDMNRGLLSFALNGENLGPAFKDELLKKGPLYPAVALLHKAGCKLVTGKPVPSYFS